MPSSPLCNILQYDKSVSKFFGFTLKQVRTGNLQVHVDLNVHARLQNNNAQKSFTL